MNVKVSPKFQVVIPRAIREALDIKPGSMVNVLQYRNRIECVPVQQLQSLRGLVKGMNTALDREDDRL